MTMKLIPQTAQDQIRLVEGWGGLAPPDEKAAVTFACSSTNNQNSPKWIPTKLKMATSGSLSSQKHVDCQTEQYKHTQRVECIGSGLKWKKPHKATFCLSC